MKHAIFKAIVRHDGEMLAALAAVPEGGARFFTKQKQESTELFVGRVSQWVKSQGAEELKMAEPDVLPAGAPPAEVLLRVKVALGITGKAADEAEVDVKDVEALDQLTSGGKPN